MNTESRIKRAKADIHSMLRWTSAVAAHGFWRSLFWIPVKENRIVLYAHKRRGYTCNPKYIAEAIIKKYPGEFELYWATDFPESVQELQDKEIIPLTMNTWKFFWTAFRAAIVVTNDTLPVCFCKRRNQYLINTWHASGAYKKVGFSINRRISWFERRVFEYEYKGADLVMSGCRAFSDSMPEAFHFPKEIFELTGTPRNDIFFRDNTGLKERIYRKYKFSPDTRILLYTPTFRGIADSRATTYGMDFKRVLNALASRFGGSWVCMYRAHYLYASSEQENEIIDVSEYPDIQELLVVADALITDYSSCIWDYALTYRPSFVYATDLQSYIQDDRGFYTPIRKWPYPLAQNNDELEQNILNFDVHQHIMRLKKHQEEMGMFETGHVAEMMADRVHDICFNKTREQRI